MQTKKFIPKILLFFFLIPYAAMILFSVLHCLLYYAYFEWFWLPEWPMHLAETIADYLLWIMVYGMFGVIAYSIFFGKKAVVWLMPLISVIASFFLPISRYFVRHIGYGADLTAEDMLYWFEKDVSAAVTLLIYTILALLVTLVERIYYALVMRTTPDNMEKTISPKHPIGLTMMLFFGSILVWTTVNFVLIGEYTLDTFLALGLEFVIDISGFLISVFVADVLSKWTKKTPRADSI